MREPFGTRDLAIKLELLRRNITHHREVIRGRPKILAQGQHLATDFAQIVHGLEQFGLSLPQTKHDSTLGHHVRRKLFGSAQNLERGLVTGARPDEWGQPFDGFQVVIVNLRTGIEHELNTPVPGMKIRHQDLDNDR